MASLYKAGAGWMIQWADENAVGGRRGVRLPKMPRTSADSFRAHVEAIVTAREGGYSIPMETIKWAGDLSDTLYAKLCGAAGLLPPRARATLGDFLTQYAASRIDLKPATRVVRSQVEKNLREHFGDGCNMRSITAGKAEEFRLFLVGEKLASTTIHKRLQVARQILKAALRHKLIGENPFDGITQRAIINPERFYFVTPEATEKLSKAAPDIHWRSIIALARWGGLRTPSETLSVKWTDIDWADGKVIVTSPKGEKDGKGTRVIPLFPELREVLDEAWELAPKGAVYVVDERYRRSAMKANGWYNCNLRTTFAKIVKRAGLKAWPRLFHALRASRETELAQRFPIHTVVAWLGNTPKIALKHYLMTTDADYAKALEPEAKPEAKPEADGVLHICMRQSPATAQNEVSQEPQEMQKTPEKQAFYGAFANLEMAGTGFEPVTSRL